MKVIVWGKGGYERAARALYGRPSFPPEVEESARQIVDEVRRRGDAAVREFAWRFDKVKLTPRRFRVEDALVAAASAGIEPAARDAIDLALANVSSFAERGMPKSWSFSPRPGVELGERFNPLDRVAVYIPGGTAPLVSTVIHTAGLARTAGVREIVALTPPRPDGSVHPAILHALAATGVREIYRLGGVYGIAAAAFGTRSVPKVEKIVGPGNAYVTAAKKLVYGDVAIDMVAGPSEIMIIADESANPECVAADMLSQAEHGSGHEQAVLVATSASTIAAVKAALRRRARRLSRSETISRVMRDGVFLIEVPNLEVAADVASRYAAEHLEIICAAPESVAAKVTAAGAIFLGPWTPEPVGDFVAGPSHVLPTGGGARRFNGLAVEQFMRRSSVIKYSRKALERELPAISKFAEMEGLDAHGLSAACRLAP